LDPTFAEESRLTFTVMYQLMSKYLDSIAFQGEIDLQSLYEPYMFEHVPKPYIKFVDDIELVINNINDDLNLISDQDSKSHRRARIMELSYLLTKKIISLDFNIEDITFTSSLKLVDDISDKGNEYPSNLYTEDDETSPVTMKSTDFSNNEYISDHNEPDDEGIYKYLCSSTQKFSSKNPKKNTSHATKKVTPPSPSRIAAGYRGSQHEQKNHPK
ncbi:14669_t:CDS:2, partial [Cetraspora pellucida]